jgi:hypothetical protein
MLDLRFGYYILQRVGKVFDDDDALCAGIAELMLEFAGGVQWIDIDHNEPGAKNAAQRNCVLQDVWRHDRNPLAAYEPQVLLQVTGKAA